MNEIDLLAFRKLAHEVHPKFIFVSGYFILPFPLTRLRQIASEVGAKILKHFALKASEAAREDLRRDKHLVPVPLGRPDREAGCNRYKANAQRKRAAKDILCVE